MSVSQQEASRGDAVQARLRSQVIEEFPVLEIDDEIKRLARKFIEKNIIPEKCPEDALHIAVAAANGMDIPCNMELQAYKQSVYQKENTTGC